MSSLPGAKLGFSFGNLYYFHVILKNLVLLIILKEGLLERKGGKLRITTDREDDMSIPGRTYYVSL